MKAKISVLLLAILTASLANVSSAETVAEKAKWEEVVAKSNLLMKEIRSQYKPVSNDEFVYKLTNPLPGRIISTLNPNERTCFQYVVIVEVQNRKITFASKDFNQLKQVPCPPLPFEK
jgi:hypothetical protein